MSSSRLPFDLHDLIKSVGTVLQTQAGEKGLTGGVDIGANCPQVVGDATRLRQILLTLIDTAVKFTGHGAVRLHASASDAGGQMLVRFDITDNGVGLSKSVQERLFQPYVQIDNNVVGRGAGTGLAL